MYDKRQREGGRVRIKYLVVHQPKWRGLSRGMRDLVLKKKSVISDSEQHISPYIFFFSTNANFFRSANVTVLAPIFEP